MTRYFDITLWRAFAPGFEDHAAWLSWVDSPTAPIGSQSPALSEMPAMQRRRVEQLGRMALQVAYWCQQADDAGIPLVFASRHGDLSRTYEMLRSLAQGEALSPTSFGLSTHNAIAAQYGIARKHTGVCQVVSAGAASAEAAFVEAQGLLADGASEVLVVVYDGQVPSAYREFNDEPDAVYAWAATVVASEGRGFSLESSAAGIPAGASAATLPHGLQVLHFLIGASPALDFADEERHWRWQRHV